jgi:hypothetical protein
LNASEQYRRTYLAIGLVVGGVLLCCAAALFNAAALGWWQLPIYGGAAAALSGTWWFRRKLTVSEQELEARRQQIETEFARVAEDEQRLEATRRTVQAELGEQATRLDQREQTLAARLTAYHEWLEFPAPVDLGVKLNEPLATDSELAALVQQDRRLNELLAQETKVLFDYILNNRYASEGQFNVELLRDDLQTLITKVARIYQPDVQRPLLETSLERVLRAAGRACLQFLVVLDELPISVKEYNLNSLYKYIRRAVKAYGMYKQAEPYWGYANTAYYLGRLAIGVNPLSIGAWWFLGTLGREGARVITNKVVNRQGMALLQNLVRVIGYEVASMYGGDFRHRDANWIYAAELTELLTEFPHSRDSIRHALKDLAALQLRSEYDRVFLTRLVANGASARPERYRAAALLTVEERRAIAQRLERFLESFIHGKSADRVAKWQAEVEARLDVKLNVGGARILPRETQVHDAVRSLAGFLNMIKQCEPAELHDLLATTRLWKELTIEQQASFALEQQENPAYLFEQPDLDPDGDVAAIYLDDLASLAARVPPREASIDELLRDIALYLRQDARMMTALIEKHLAAELDKRLTSMPQRKSTPSAVSRAALDLLGDERAEFLYDSISVSGLKQQGGLWLLGTSCRLVLLAIEPRPQVLWRADGPVSVNVVKRLIGGEAQIRGGTWLVDLEAARSINVGGPLFGSSHAYFKALLDWQPSGNDHGSRVAAATSSAKLPESF